MLLALGDSKAKHNRMRTRRDTKSCSPFSQLLVAKKAFGSEMRTDVELSPLSSKIEVENRVND